MAGGSQSHLGKGAVVDTRSVYLLTKAAWGPAFTGRRGPIFLCEAPGKQALCTDRPRSHVSHLPGWTQRRLFGKEGGQHTSGRSPGPPREVRWDALNCLAFTLEVCSGKGFLPAHLQISFSASSSPNCGSKASCILVLSRDRSRQVSSRFLG